eukprot:1286640-Prymnesium_polylepis.1
MASDHPARALSLAAAVARCQLDCRTLSRRSSPALHHRRFGKSGRSRAPAEGGQASQSVSARRGRHARAPCHLAAAPAPVAQPER